MNRKKTDQQNTFEITSRQSERMNVPSDAIVFVAGGQSERQVDFQIDNSGSNASQTDVIVNYKKAPVVLILSAYGPTIWNILWTKNTNIAGVYVDGYDRQVISGLKNDVPYTIKSFFDDQGYDGGFYGVTEEQLSRINSFSRSIFGKDVAKAYLSKNGEVVIGDVLDGDEVLFTSNAHTPQSYYDKNAPLAGKAGLDAAMQKGLIRLATQDDFRTWAQLKKEKTKDIYVPELVRDGDDLVYSDGSGYNIGDTYVILKQFNIPAGLYGGYAVTFMLPSGVPRPTGDLGHSMMLDFATARCEGAVCDMMQ